MSQLPGNITELIAALEGLGKKNLNEESELFGICRGVFEKLQRLSEFDPSSLKKTIEILKDLRLEIKELNIDEIEIGDKKLDSRALNEQDLKELLEDYEKAKNDDEREKKQKEIYQRTGQKNVKQFIKVQREIALKNAEKLNTLSSEIRAKVVSDLAIDRLVEKEERAQIIEEAVLKNEQNFEAKEFKNKLIIKGYSKKEANQIIEKIPKIREEIKKQNIVENQISPEVKKEILEVLTLGEENKKEELLEVVEKASQGEELNTQELTKQLQTKGYGDEEINKIIEKTEEVWPEIIAQKREVTEVQINPEIREKIVEELVLNKQGESEKLFEIIEEASLKNDQDYETKELKKELKKTIKDPEKIDDLIQRVEEIRAEIKIEQKAEEIAKTTYEKLLNEKLPVNKGVEEKIKNEILIAWKEGDGIKIPKELEEISGAKVIIKEAEKAADIFKNENIRTIVNYRRVELGKEISQELRKNGIQDETLIREYVEVVNNLTNNPESARIEENRSDIYNYVQNENPNKGAGEIERSIDEARFMAGNVVMAPKKFNKLIQKYNVLREKIGSDKLPKIKEVRVVEKMSAMFKESPKLLKLMNGAQGVLGAIEKITNFPTLTMSKLGGKLFEKLGGKAVEKIGGEAAKTFVRESAKIITKEGLKQGTRSILTGLLSGGTAGAGGGTVAAVVAAFQALPVVGQVIAVVVIAAIAVLAIVKPIIDGAKKIISKITGFDPNGVKRFLSDTLGLGKFVGSVGQFFFDIGTFLIGIPALLGLISFTAVIAPVIIFFFLGIMTYSLLSQNLLSSLVPPTQAGGGYCILKSSLLSEGGEGAINCDQRAPENDFPGISKANFVRIANQWVERGGKNYSEECYNDTVNRALCAGINPAYALWAWVHESGASNYSIEDVEDFGIHFIPENKNYNKQITEFLKLDPGGACPELGYWLSFATNYLNGSCDPDEKNPISGGTGREYLAEMEATWSMVSSLPMPADIKVPVAGNNCDQIGGSSDLPITDEYTDENGDVWVCYGGGGDGPGEIPNFEPWDPNIPVPEGCPDRLPSAGYFTQGPFAPGCSHSSMGVPAIDLGAGAGTPIYATHPGVAVLVYDGIYGFYIDVHGKCEGKDFYTRYAHMPQGGYRVGNNQTVIAGQQIGVVNNTGSSTGNHLHYHITGLDNNKFGQYLGLDVHTTQALWGCCDVCPTRP